ncbi:MAG: hypothetical protein GC202_14285 [Alphaproteobacteria bacterium]|nr:hypothetical protein [Alphaproteobacteria bacterium]
MSKTQTILPGVPLTFDLKRAIADDLEQILRSRGVVGEISISWPDGNSSVRWIGRSSKADLICELRIAYDNPEFWAVKDGKS